MYDRAQLQRTRQVEEMFMLIIKGKNMIIGVTTEHMDLIEIGFSLSRKHQTQVLITR